MLGNKSILNYLRGHGGGGCFPAGTQITTPIGPVTIECLKAGDEVISFNAEGMACVSRIDRVHQHEMDKIILIKFWNGQLRVTPNHWLLNQFHAFACAVSFEIDDALIDLNGHLRPIAEILDDGQECVYNLTVTPYHTFIANNVCVHNGGLASAKYRRAIKGAGGGGESKGGGGGAQRAPVEAADNLRSKQFARVLDLITNGPARGLVNGSKSIYYDGTPLQNIDGTFNFSGVNIAVTLGTQAQSYIPGRSGVESETAVNVKIVNATPVVRQITNENVNRVRITIAIPQLTEQILSTGDLNGYSISLAIDVQSNGGGYVTQGLYDGGFISGKTTSRYQRHYEINLLSDPPWDVRVRRISADSVSSAIVDSFWWESYTEIIDAKFTYPNSMVVGQEIDASQFSVIPGRSFDCYGIEMQVPTNYDPTTRVYTGIWDGSFKLAYNTNPAWAFYMMLTNDLFGLGSYIDAEVVDKWALYDIGIYCDELVEDGFGGFEPRFTCNLYLQTQAEAFKVLSDMASIFRGMLYWGSGVITAVADKPEDVSALYTNSNVIDGLFAYQGSSVSTRHTVVLVTWNDPSDADRQKVEYVEDQDGVARYGIVQTEIITVGCNSRGQARRAGLWLLYSEIAETEINTFKVGLDALNAVPGNIIMTQDQNRAGARLSGRIVSATVNDIEIDSPIEILSGITYTVFVIQPDGLVESAELMDSPGPSISVLHPLTPLNQAPQSEAVWIISNDEVVPELWRILAVGEVDKTKFQIIALQHDSNKFARIEQGLKFETLPTSLIDLQPPAPTNLIISETLFEAGPGIVSNRTAFSWSGSTGRYKVSYQGLFNNRVVIPEIGTPSIDIDGLPAGLYTFYVQLINAIGRISLASSLQASIYGKTALPANVSGFSVIKVGGVAYAQWQLPSELDVKIGGYIVIRHSIDNGIGISWNNTYVMDVFPGNQIEGQIPLVTGSYMAKQLDSSGNFSESAAIFVATEGMVTGWTTVGTISQHPTFPGAKTQLIVANNDLQLDASIFLDDQPLLLDDWPMIDSMGGIRSTGTYEFDTYLDLATVVTRRFEADIRAQQFDTADSMDSRTSNIDNWDDFDGAIVNDCDVTLLASITDDDPSASPVWGPWVPFVVADFTCRAAKFKLEFVSGNTSHNMKVSLMTIHAKIPV